jgi:hypothetical protein
LDDVLLTVNLKKNKEKRMATQMGQPMSRRAIKYDQGNAYVEVIRQDMYNRKQLTAGTSQNINFFKGLTGNMGLLDTNMTVDGMLPSPQAYSVYGVSCFVQQGIAEADIQRLMNEATVEFRISNKPYLQIPFHSIPAAGGLTGMCATTENNTRIFQAQNGVPSPLVYLPLDIEGDPIHLVSQQDFVVQLQTFNTVAFTTTIYVTMHLVGVLYRPVL